MGKVGKHDEVILFEKIKQGKIEFFEILFEQYYQALCNFAYLFLRNNQQAEEVVSDVFVNLWVKRNEINIHTSLKSFLYQSTRNAVISSLRKHKPEFTNDLKEDIKTDNLTPETILLNKEFEKTMHELIGELPKMSGLVLRMKKIDGLKYKEIAEILNISERTVENHVAQGIKNLRIALTKKPMIFNYFKDE